MSPQQLALGRAARRCKSACGSLSCNLQAWPRSKVEQTLLQTLATWRRPCVLQTCHQNHFANGLYTVQHLRTPPYFPEKSTGCRATCLQSGEAHSACRGVDEHRVPRPDASDAPERLLRRGERCGQRAESHDVSSRRHGDERRGRGCNGCPQAAVRNAPDALAHREAAVGVGAGAKLRHDAGMIRPCACKSKARDPRSRSIVKPSKPTNALAAWYIVA